MRRFGLIGYPLSHSFSQRYFTEKFAQLGLTDCVYDNYPLEDIYQMKQVVLKEHADICGLNVTIPYKQLVIRHLDYSVDTLPIRACNCIKIVDGKLIGYNTDIIGFDQTISPFLKPHHTHALVLGNGGAAEAVKYVLGKKGIQYEAVSRKVHDGSTKTYQDLNKEVIQQNLLIINTSPLGMYPNEDSYPDIPYEYLTPKHHLFDLIYNPAETKFLEKGRLQGASIQNGYEMLVLQAEESWRIWNHK